MTTYTTNDIMTLDLGKVRETIDRAVLYAETIANSDPERYAKAMENLRIARDGLERSMAADARVAELDEKVLNAEARYDAIAHKLQTLKEDVKKKIENAARDDDDDE